MTLRLPFSWTKSRLSRYCLRHRQLWFEVGVGRKPVAADGAIRENLGPTISMGKRAHTFLSSGCAGAMVNSSSKA